ncbi:MAG: FAD-dependent oxidoreductase [Pseudomonadota bacterium]
MADRPRIGIVGAGLAGLTAADHLRGGGFEVIVWEKSRDIAGRLATRRSRNGLAFDHGPVALAPRTATFRAFLDAAVADGRAARWPADRGSYVGLPDWRSLLRPLATDIDIRFGTEVAAITEAESGWSVALAGGACERVDWVVCTVPAPQAARLLAAVPPYDGAGRITESMDPCWTLMAAWDADTPAADIVDGAAPFETIHRSSAKPGRDATPVCWVGHATRAWSDANLERSRDEVADALLPHLAAQIGAEPETAIHVVAHRWRYARAHAPTGVMFYGLEDRLLVGGDWTSGGDADGAHAVGRAMAIAISWACADGAARA